MKLDINQNGILELTEVYNSIELKTNANELITICMRDSGFEFTYQGCKYSAKEGVLEKTQKKELVIDKNLPQSSNM